MSYYDDSYDDSNYWDEYEYYAEGDYDDEYYDAYEDPYYDAEEGGHYDDYYYEGEGDYQPQNDRGTWSQGMGRALSNFNHHDPRNGGHNENDAYDWDESEETQQDYGGAEGYNGYYQQDTEQYTDDYQDPSYADYSGGGGSYGGDGGSGQSGYDETSYQHWRHSADDTLQEHELPMDVTGDPSNEGIPPDQASTDAYGQRADEPRRIRPYLRQLFFSRLNRRKSITSSPSPASAGDHTLPFLSPHSPPHNTDRVHEFPASSPTFFSPAPLAPAEHTIQARNLLWGSRPSPIEPPPRAQVMPWELPAALTPAAKYGERRGELEGEPRLMGFLAPRTP